MKPDWRNAPSWAGWLAMQPNGDWYWYRSEPSWGDEDWTEVPDSRFEIAAATGCAGIEARAWEETKESRCAHCDGDGWNYLDLGQCGDPDCCGSPVKGKCRQCTNNWSDDDE